MHYNFPEIQTTRTIAERLQKIKDEIAEFEKTPTADEAIDVLHSTETFLRGYFKDEKVLDEAIKLVFRKNDKRGYYSKKCF